MKRKLLTTLLLFSISICSLLLGCGSSEADTQTDESSRAESEADESETNELVYASDEEKEFFNEWIKEYENYGFALTGYDSIDCCDFYEVFYSGAGIDVTPTQKEHDAFLAVCQDMYDPRFEIYTDIVMIKRKDADEFLKRKTGLSLDSFEDVSFLGIYVEECDAYFRVCGDTNYMDYYCFSCTVDGDVYSLGLMPKDRSRNACLMRVKKDGDNYIILSNELH